VNRRPVILAVVAAVALSGCSSGGAAGTLSDQAPRPSSTSATIPASGNSQYGIGTTVLITASGFVPTHLLAPMGSTITFENTSSRTQSVHFDNYGRVDSGAIAPGATWSYRADALASILYHSTYQRRFRGHLQVQLTGESGP
jgi:plastocyanin